MRPERGESERKMRFKVKLDVGNVTALQANERNEIKWHKTE